MISKEYIGSTRWSSPTSAPPSGGARGREVEDVGKGINDKYKGNHTEK